MPDHIGGREVCVIFRWGWTPSPKRATFAGREGIVIARVCWSVRSFVISQPSTLSSLKLFCVVELKCYNNPCRNGGTCQEDFLTPAYICHCPDGYSGTNCDSSETTVLSLTAYSSVFTITEVKVCDAPL